MKTLRALALSLLVCSAALAQNAALMPIPRIQLFDGNGYPLSGGLVFTCVAGSSCPGTPLATYTDSTAATPNANPVVLDASGSAAIWLGSSAYKVVVQTSAGVVLSTTDNVTNSGLALNNTLRATLAGSTGATLIGYQSVSSSTVRTAAAKLSDSVSVKDYGALGNGTNNDAPAFLAATAANPGKAIFFPAGTYSFNNATSAIALTGWNGEIYGEGNGSAIACTSLSNNCLNIISSTTGIKVHDLSLYFATALATCNPSALVNCTSVRNGSQAFAFWSDTNVMVDSVYVHDGPSAGFLFQGCKNVAVSNTRVSNLWANAYFVTNSSEVRFTNISSDNTQDAGIEFSQYDGLTPSPVGTSQDATVDGYTSFQDFSSILVNGYINVTITNVASVNTWGNAIGVTQDNSTTTTHWPDNVNISNVVISGPGTSYPVNSAVRAIELYNFKNNPATGFRSHVTLSNIRVNGGNAGSNASAFATASDAYYDLSLNNVSIDNSPGECFDFFVAYVHADHLSCTKAASYGYVIRAGSQFIGTDLRAYDAGGGYALQNSSTGTVLLNGLHFTSDATPSVVGIYDAATSGVHVFAGIDYLTADGTTPTVSIAGSSGTVLYSGTVNGKPLNMTSTAFAGLVAQQDGTLSGGPAQFSIKGVTNPNNVLTEGFDTTNLIGYLQASVSGVGNKPLALNPNNGDVLVGTSTDNGKAFQVNGTSWLNGTVTIPGIAATSGTPYVCVTTSGALVKSATACSGT